MPGGDRTGPCGAGAMTGRGAGYCGGNDAPGWTTGAPGYGRGGGFGRGRGGAGRGMGRGFGRGFGRGRGAGWGMAPAQQALPAASAGQELAALQAQIQALQAQLERIGRRLEDEGPAPAGA